MIGDNIDILLVEDNIHDVMFIKEALSEMKLELKLFRLADGIEAVNYLLARDQYSDRDTADRPKLILTDLRMPRMGGCELLRNIKADARTREIPVVVLSTSELESEITESYLSGASSYVVKPMDYSNFAVKAKRLFEYWFGVNMTKDMVSDELLYSRFRAI